MIEAIGVCHPYECFDTTKIRLFFLKLQRENIKKVAT